MAWLRVDDGFVEHEKIIDLTDKAFRLHMAALCYCSRNLTDGRISPRALKVISAIVGGNTKKAVADLIQAGLWTLEDDGHAVNDYLDWNPSADKVKADRARNADRQARHRNAVTNTVTNTVSNGAPSQPLPSQGFSSKEQPSLTTPAQGGQIEHLLKRLIVATGVQSRPADLRKLERTVAANRSTERDLALAIEAATGRGVRDPLGVALSELKKLANGRNVA